jgi:uncharacterized LabA/DUF88 family protein
MLELSEYMESVLDSETRDVSTSRSGRVLQVLAIPKPGGQLPDGSVHPVLVAEEKGIDVRIALDVIRTARQNDLDVAVILSQDQDFSEIADEVRVFAQEQGRWIKIASAFPASAASRNKRGINGTDWIRIDRANYEACIDPKAHRPKSMSQE